MVKRMDILFKKVINYSIKLQIVLEVDFVILDMERLSHEFLVHGTVMTSVPRPQLF